MKKLFNYALLAAALLVGVNVNAVNVAKIGTTEYPTIEAAFAAAQGTALEPVKITMLAHADFGTCRIDLSDKHIIWDLAGFDVGTAPEAVYSGFVMNGGYFKIMNSVAKTVTLTLKPNWKKVETKDLFNYPGDHTGYAILIYGSDTDEPNYSTFILDGYNKENKIKFLTQEGVGYAIKLEAADGEKGNRAAFGANIELDKCYVTGHYGALFVSGNIERKIGEHFAEIYIKKDAELHGTNTTDNFDNSAVTCNGYVKMIIEGTLVGGSGLAAKSGDITIQGDAHISSDADIFTPCTQNGSGFDGGAGCGLALDSEAGYAGNMTITITGNATIEGSAGYAIYEDVTSGDESKTEALVIESGNIIGGTAGCINATADLQETVKVDGTITGGTFTDDISNFLPDVVGVIVPHTDPETGVTTYSVETIPGGIDEARGKDIHTSTADDDVAIEDGKNETVGADDELVCKSLIVEEGATLTINGKLTVAGLNIAGKVTVAQNGILIVKEKGVVCFNAQDFVIEAKEGAMGQFLLDPTVPGNTHPTATVQFISKAKNLTTWDRFGVPAYEGMTLAQMHCETPGLSHYVFTWNNVKDDWDQVMSATQVLLPFQGLTLTNNSAEGGVVYDFPCSLVGNANASLDLAKGWNSFSNSYTAKADAISYLKDIIVNHNSEIGGFIYTYVNGRPTTVESWDPVSYGDISDGSITEKLLDPMQAFIIERISENDVKGGLDYEKNVWDPAMGISTDVPGAPRQMMDMNKVVINLTDAQGNEGRLTIREAAEFTADYENGYDVPMLENAGKFNFYATTDYNNQIQVATNDIDGQVLTLATKGETSFTMSFSDVRGEMMAIRDNMTGDVIEMAEGVTYNFMANANEVSERFTIIAAAKAPTALKKAEAAVKAAKFIRHDQVILQNNGRLFNVLGAEVK